MIKTSDALLITDIQNDFLPGGALPVKDGNEIIPVINQYLQYFENAKTPLAASRDWHPRDHISFKEQGGQWPPHCVQDTKGANFSPNLKLPSHTLIISKATDPQHEAYSAFDRTNLAYELRLRGVNRLFIGGLATDYCVVNTVVDACKLGFETVVLMDATLGIDVNPGDVDRAIQTMLKNGAQEATAGDFPDAVDALPIEETTSDALSEKSSQRADVNKKARMRPKGANKQMRTERG
jgi:nicotinamidase/pyrazinamidase